ncbi:sperm acrosome membrane-associated protein 4-like [Pipistrellus kuhlii]|uniref:sperm acrosome membrane-associated protein 4-like n=1 Tax=Pipistrellus kuhlii TaxID=59472 RepID=UPI001E26FC62|nr:sperm acrosome membrane-associated protein 4-like [Pipistrellus kuhlii]
MDCIFCDLTKSSKYPRNPITCGGNKECFMDKGKVPSLSPVLNKGTMKISSYGRLEEPIIYQGVTYSLTSTYNYGKLCNRAPTPIVSLKAGTTCLALHVLLLFQPGTGLRAPLLLVPPAPPPSLSLLNGQKP